MKLVVSLSLKVHHRYTRSLQIETELNHAVRENCALLACYAASSGSSIPTFRDNLLDPDFCPLMGPIGCPETSVRSFHYSPHNWPEERSSCVFRGGNLKTRMHILLAVREINSLKY